MSKEKCSFIAGIILIIVGLILISIGECNAQTSVFNQRDYQSGYYKITVQPDSIHIYEQFVYESAGYKTLWKNEFSESIVMTSKGTMYQEIFTEQNRYVLFYCNVDTNDFSICEVYCHPVIGEIIHYYNKNP